MIIDDVHKLEPLMKEKKKSYLNYRRGKITLGGREWPYASRYEKNWMCYLQLLKDDKKIKEWYRNTTLLPFSTPAKYTAPKSGEAKTITGYIPDFIVILNDGTFEIQEIKGWNNEKAKAQLIRFRLEYPTLFNQFSIIRQSEFIKIEQSLGEQLKKYGWESVLRKGEI